MRALLLTLVAPFVLACAPPPARAGALVDVQIVDRDGGGTLPLYPARGKNYVAGIPGHRYSVRLVNRTGARVMTVLSVDGVNAITGQTASPDQSGYVLGPYESTEISGWRKDMSAIAAFEFTALSDSYAARTGRPNNVGVIGVAVFREKIVPPPQPVWRERDDEIASADRRAQPEGGKDSTAAEPRPAPPASAASQSAGAAAPRDSLKRESKALAEESLGTGHGARESSYATYTTFERDNVRPYEVVSIWYDSVANLQARGVIPRPRPIPQEPQAFPAGFVADPPGR
jgi:hypothetical protein